MKRIILGTSLATALLASGQTETAVGLPNCDFDGGWRESIPWTSSGNSEPLQGASTPDGWTISHVMGTNFMNNWMGSTVLGEQISAGEGNTAVRLYNSPNSVMSDMTVPGFITLGTTWSTSVGMGGSADGGTFGGVDFAYRPDAVRFVYRRSHGSASPEEAATLVGYIWKGRFTQEDVPGEIVLAGTPAKVAMVDRDRSILGMETAQGGAVSKSDDAACIAKIIHSLEGDTEDWTSVLVEFEYLQEDAVPEKLNLIFAAGDYFSTNSGQGNTLDVDDVELVYYSRLNSLSINGVDVPLEPDKYEYTVPAPMPESADDFIFSVAGRNAVSGIQLNPSASSAVIEIRNVGSDVDGRSVHSYVLNFEDNNPLNSIELNGKLSVEMGGSPLCSDQDATVEITYISEDKCRFFLPNLVLGDLGPVGDIRLDDVSYSESDGVKTYSGREDNMSLMGGNLVADYVELQGTSSSDGAANLHIDVMWNNMPINVTFVASGVSSVKSVHKETGVVEFYTLDGIRVVSPVLAKGVYIRRIGNTTSKIIIK